MGNKISLIYNAKLNTLKYLRFLSKMIKTNSPLVCPLRFLISLFSSLIPSYEGKNRSGIKLKTAKITKKHNGHTRGEFVLIILLKKRIYFKVFNLAL